MEEIAELRRHVEDARGGLNEERGGSGRGVGQVGRFR